MISNNQKDEIVRLEIYLLFRYTRYDNPKIIHLGVKNEVIEFIEIQI